MSISHFLKVIGRGTKGAGDLDREQAKSLFTLILKGEVSDLELGAFCLAMRYKGESVSELMGFMDALEPEIHRMDVPSRPTIILPSYNGSRKQTNLTPLLAGLLARSGWTVIVQGVEQDLSRITSCEIFKELSWPILQNVSEFDGRRPPAWPVFCSTKTLSPKLNKLLEVRTQLGLRNSGHVLAKLLNPVGASAWCVSNYTHPEYSEKLKTYFRTRSVNAVLMRGNEGEPTASLQRLPAMHFLFSDGQEKSGPEERFQDASPFEGLDAASTAQMTAHILSGTIPAPVSIARQAALMNEMILGQGF